MYGGQACADMGIKDPHLHERKFSSCLHFSAIKKSIQLPIGMVRIDGKDFGRLI